MTMIKIDDLLIIIMMNLIIITSWIITYLNELDYDKTIYFKQVYWANG